MKSRCLLNSCNSTSQFISILFRCWRNWYLYRYLRLISFWNEMKLISRFCFFSFFYEIRNFLFLLWVNLYMITGIYLHDPPPFRPIFHGPSLFWVSKSCDPPSVSTPLPRANFWQAIKYNSTHDSKTHVRVSLSRGHVNQDKKKLEDEAQLSFNLRRSFIF